MSTLVLAAAAFALLATFGVCVSWTPAMLGAGFMNVVMIHRCLRTSLTWNVRAMVCSVLPCSFAVAVPLRSVWPSEGRPTKTTIDA